MIHFYFCTIILSSSMQSVPSILSVEHTKKSTILNIFFLIAWLVASSEKRKKKSLLYLCKRINFLLIVLVTVVMIVPNPQLSIFWAILGRSQGFMLCLPPPSAPPRLLPSSYYRDSIGFTTPIPCRLSPDFAFCILTRASFLQIHVFFFQV